MVCILLFVHNLLERIEGADGQRMWLWLGRGKWQLLLVLGLLSLMFQLFFWSEVIQVNHRSICGLHSKKRVTRLKL
jgi:drug/metabolite transporter superfamily protein YnfA